MIEDTPEWRVRKRLKLERKRREWDQIDLARAANIKSKTTIVELEKGRRMSEDVELSVEDVLGWKPGGLDRIRADLEPIPTESSRPTLEELARMPADEAWRYLKRVKEVKGALYAQQFRQDFLDYMDRRSTPSDRETRS